MTRVAEVRSWSEFLAVVESPQFRGWAFRGQRDAAWPLVSSLTRYLLQFVPPDRWQLQEQRAIRIFRRKAHHFLSDASALEEGLRCLSLMQHHGAPTRLIDLTKSPYVAAFFALEAAVCPAAVFALNTPALWTEAAPRGQAGLTREAIDPRTPGNLEKYYLSNAYPVVWPGEPWAMDRRLVAQAGTFVLPGMLGASVEEHLSHYPGREELLLKIVLDPRMRTEAMEALYRMNITNATLFPDLDGLARSIAYELEVYWLAASGPPEADSEAAPKVAPESGAAVLPETAEPGPRLRRQRTSE